MPTTYTTRGRFSSRIPEIEKKLPIEFNIATLEAAGAIEEIAKALCPVGTGRVHLRDAIHVERTYEAGRVLTWVVAWSKEAWYGHLVEWGSVHPHQGDHPWRVPPHPFMVPAAEAGRGIARERADRAVKAASVS